MDSITFLSTIQLFENEHEVGESSMQKCVIPREHVERYDDLFQRRRQIQSPKGA